MTGVQCKGRVDKLLDNGALVGLKTARSVDPRLFAIQAAQLGYHLQWSYYNDGLDTLGQKPDTVIEVAVESLPPHDVVVYRIDDEVLELGQECYRKALMALVVCRETNVWPGQSNGQVQTLEMPNWAYPDDGEEPGYTEVSQ